MSMDNNSTILLAVCLVGLSTWLYSLTKKPPAPFPPGPKGLPLLGNITDLPKSQPGDTYTKWGETYGGVVHVSALGQSIIVINDVKHAVNMLDKKSNLYSDRPTIMMAGRLVGWENANVLLPFGDAWKEHRRMFAQFMGTRSKVDEFADVFQNGTHRYLQRLLADPAGWVDHGRKFAGNIVLKLIYGYQSTDEEDRTLKPMNDAMKQFSEMVVTNAFLVDVFPILRHVPEWLPGAAWKKKVPKYRKTLHDAVNLIYDWVKGQVAAGTALPSFTSNMLPQPVDNKPITANEDHVIKWAAASLYSGGVDTTPAVIESFFLAMCIQTSEQQKAQAELDAIIGTDRLPTIADRPHLPYVEALISEVIRKYFGGVGPPHMLREDDIYDGYFIPKGAIIITNLWQFAKDPKIYTNPEAFFPERFLASEGRAKEADPRDYLFGFGRRICPANHFADASLWIACASLLAVFDIRPPVKDGKPELPAVKHTDGAIPHPEPFECVIKPRSNAAEAVIRSL